MVNFDKRFQSISADVLSRVAKIDEIKGRWTEGVALSPQLLGRLKRSVLITSSGASTRIEGARLSDEDVENFIKGLKVNKLKDRDKQEVKGYYELLENVFNAWKTIRFNESSVKHLHKELLKYVEKDARHRGEYKVTENHVEMFDAKGRSVGIVFETTPAYLTPKETQELLSWTEKALQEKQYHPLLIIGNFIIQFLQIHPFQDGNGRLSRILTNLLLLKNYYGFVPYVSHEKIIEDTKDEYYLALRKSQRTFGKQENITPWLEYFLKVLEAQAISAINMLQEEKVEMLLSPKQLLVWEYLLSVSEATAGDIVRETEVVRPTVNQILDKFLKMKKVDRIGMGRATRYRVKK